MPVYVLEYTNVSNELVYWHPDEWVDHYQNAMAFATELEAQRHFVATRRPWCRVVAVPPWPGMKMGGKNAVDIPVTVYVIEYTTVSNGMVYWRPDKWVKDHEDSMPFATKLEAEEQAVRSNCRGSRVKAVLLRPQMEHRMKLKSNFVPDTEFEGK